MMISAKDRVWAAIRVSNLLAVCGEAVPNVFEAFTSAFSIICELENDTIDPVAISSAISSVRNCSKWRSVADRNPETIYWRDKWIALIERHVGLPPTADSTAAINMDPDAWLKLRKNCRAQ